MDILIYKEPFAGILIIYKIIIIILLKLNILISMAIGKSKKSYGKKGTKKKVVDSISRKEWFELKAPAPFQSESFGYTCANRTQGLSNNIFYFRKSLR